MKKSSTEKMRFRDLDLDDLVPGLCFRRPNLPHVYTVIGECQRLGIGHDTARWRFFRILITDPDGRVSLTERAPLPRWMPIRLALVSRP